jgi:2-octaprenyl-6-methoxyphenol hydroxylase
MVGASLAISLAQQPLRIALIEAARYEVDTANTLPSYDDRAIALAFGSRRIFEGMALWDDIATQSTAIERIHVSDQGRFGCTRLDCREEGVEALGYVAIARHMGACLWQRLQQLDNLTIISPAKLEQLKLGDDHATAVIQHTEHGTSETLSGRLIVAADGGDSPIRQLLDIPTRQYDYRQTAIIANISTERPHQHVAYERFTRHGPLALLPMAGQRCSLVWTRSPADAERLLALSDADFLAELQPCFGQRLGRLLQVGQRSAYPLRLVQAQQQVRPRLALIGNAAHTLHPIAGQGFNLGLRDVATLAQCLAEAVQEHVDIGSSPVLQPYAQWRQRDHRQVIGFTNTLVQTFSNAFPPLALARNLGLIATDIVPPFKHGLARHAMGLAGKLPRLARGLPL